MCLCVLVHQRVQNESLFHLQITSVEIGADQLVPYVCQGLGSLHDEQQEILASVCCFTLPNNNREPKFFSVFHTSYLLTARNSHSRGYDSKRGAIEYIFNSVFLIFFINMLPGLQVEGIGAAQLEKMHLFMQIVTC